MTVRTLGLISGATPTLAWTCVLCLAGCAATGGGGSGATEVPAGPAGATSLTAGRSVKGEPIPYFIHGHGGECVLLIATIHGDEPAGTPLVEELRQRLYGYGHGDLLDGRKLIVVPVANPDGYATGRRTNSRGIDLNRNFPAGNWKARHTNGPKPLSEPESQALHDLIHRYRPDRIVSIHQPLGCIDYDGPPAAHTLARSMGQSSTLPVRKLGSRSGSLGSYAGLTLQIPTITLELPGGAQRLSRDELWSRYGPMLIAAIEG